MDEWYSFVQAKLAEERAHAGRARLARLARRVEQPARGDGAVATGSWLRARIGHAIVAAGSAVEGSGASHPHVPAAHRPH